MIVVVIVITYYVSNFFRRYQLITRDSGLNILFSQSQILSLAIVHWKRGSFGSCVAKESIVTVVPVLYERVVGQRTEEVCGEVTVETHRYQLPH
jgi:hypothetical protein